MRKVSLKDWIEHEGDPTQMPSEVQWQSPSGLAVEVFGINIPMIAGGLEWQPAERIRHLIVRSLDRGGNGLYPLCAVRYTKSRSRRMAGIEAIFTLVEEESNG